MTRVKAAELDDWRHEARIKGRLQDLYFIPYLLSPKGQVELRLDFIVAEDQEKAFERCQRCAYFNPLQEDDSILAVDGQPISSSYDLLAASAGGHVLADRPTRSKGHSKSFWKEADHDFENQLNLQ